MSHYAAPTELATALRQGQMVILVDDQERENEGDLIAAAPLITPQAINFMATHARGLICLTITEARAQALGLAPMVQQNNSPLHTNFTVSIEAATGVSTGISTADRAHTIRTAVKPDANAHDIVCPGHVFPLVARQGGVLVRAGHTEAGCDLVGMAGLESSAVIVEILKEDGSMARRPDLLAFAAKHKLLIGTIADLITYRLEHERTVSKTHQQMVHLPQGDFTMHTFSDSVSKTTHIALEKSSFDTQAPLVRVHQYHGVSDVLGLHASGSWSLQHALTTIGDQGGVLLLLHYPHCSESHLNQFLRNPQSTKGEIGHRSYISHGTGAQILRDMGIREMRLLSSPLHFGGLAAFGLKIVEFIEPPAEP